MIAMTSGPGSTKVNFTRKRAVIWACDLEQSTNILNDPNCVENAEEFLKRFFFVSSVLLRVTGATVRKWTGDGFLAAYEISLDRDLGEQASKIAIAAWQLTFLINITQLGIECPKKFKVRHGLTYEPDAILIEHQDSDLKSIDVIGRNVVLATRLAGIKAEFPGIVTQKKILDSIPLSERKCGFLRRRFTREEMLKYFKGENWATKEIYASCKIKHRVKSLASVERRISKAIKNAEHPEAVSMPHWIGLFIDEMIQGPQWASKMVEEMANFTRDQLLGTLKMALPLLKKARTKSTN